MATRRRTSRRRAAGTTAPTKRRRRTYGARTHRRVGSTGVGRTATRRPSRRRRVGSVQTLTKQIIPLAGGMLLGYGAQHFILRPLEKHIAARSPMLGKYMGGLEILIGGLIAIKGKGAIVKGAGLGIMAGGVQVVTKQLNIYHENPAITGIGDYTTVQMPVNGEIRSMIGSILDNGNPARTNLIAGTGRDDRWGMNDRDSRTNLLAGIYGLNGKEEDNLLYPKTGDKEPYTF